MMNSVRRTRSGLMVRFDEGIGLLIYSPFNGLIFGVHTEYAQQTINWLDKKKGTAPSEKFEKLIGPGWFIPHQKAEYDMPYLLPSGDVWQVLNPQWPIVINWFLTGKCPLACEYCYAEDLMWGKISEEPSEKKIEEIAENILSYNPIAVVLTGGDPLFSPHLFKVIKLLYGRVGIMVDTNAYVFNAKHIDAFKKHRVAIRISFDSEIPRINDELRPIHPTCKSLANQHRSTVDAAIKALCQCLDTEITTSVQSVATKKTANDLPALGDKLFRLGVRSWRIHRIAPSEDRMAGYKELVGSVQQRQRMYKHIFSELIKAYDTRWNKHMALQITHNVPANAVILVAPDGTFYTESSVHAGKIILDEKNRRKPRLRELFNKLDRHGHAGRYLNLTSLDAVK